MQQHAGNTAIGAQLLFSKTNTNVSGDHELIRMKHGHLENLSCTYGIANIMQLSHFAVMKQQLIVTDEVCFSA